MKLKLDKPTPMWAGIRPGLDEVISYCVGMAIYECKRDAPRLKLERVLVTVARIPVKDRKR
jgi:hypothetical protein